MRAALCVITASMALAACAPPPTLLWSPDRLLFFRSGGGNLVWMHDLTTGSDRALLSIGSKFLLSTDATGIAPAYMGSPPVFDPPLLFVHDWTIRAYRVDN